MLQKLPFRPGLYKDDSPLEAKGYWVEADKIRFVRGLPETIYGWEKASNASLLGLCRGALTWADNGRNPYAALGTHLRLYAMDVDGNVTDITPAVARAQGVAITIATVAGSAAVTAGWTAHGLVQDQKFAFDGATVTSIGGVTVNGTFAVASVVDANTFTFVAAQTAAASAGPTATTVNTTVFLAPGQVDGLGGLGYGTGGYGTGGYGSSAAGFSLYPRTWSLAPWGQNLIANPRGGGIYEWAPNVAATELVANGSFTGSAAGWSLGAGISYGTNNLVFSAANGSVTQTVTTSIAAWHLLSLDVGSWSTGAIQPVYNGTSIGPPIAANGTYRTAFHSGAGGARTLAIAGSNASCTVDNVSVQVLTSASLIPSAPPQATCIFATGERILVACGCADASGNFDALRVRWTDTQNNQSWAQAATNLAGAFTLTNGSRIVRGLAGTRENLLFTDTAVYTMRYVPDPAVVYSFTEIATGCGLIGPNAVAQAAGRTFWLSPAGEFFAYDGSLPRPLASTLQRDVQDNLAWVQQDKVHAFPIAARNEVWWIYPDARDGNECSRYAIYNFIEDHWSAGTFDRTAWADAGVFPYPLSVDTSGAIRFQEKGFTADGAARSWSIASAYVDLADGDTHMRLVGIEPDAEDLQGGYQIAVGTRLRSAAGLTSRNFGPYGITGATGKVSARANGQEARFTFSATAAPSFWRLGALRLDLQETGRRR
jgi:hypothetical protein